MDYYVWNTQDRAQEALDYINTCGIFPIYPVNNSTGEPEITKQPTECWAEAPRQLKTGRWCFPRLDLSLLGSLNISDETHITFFDAYNPDIEIHIGSDFKTNEEVS